MASEHVHGVIRARTQAADAQGPMCLAPQVPPGPAQGLAGCQNPVLLRHSFHGLHQIIVAVAIRMPLLLETWLASLLSYS